MKNSKKKSWEEENNKQKEPIVRKLRIENNLVETLNLVHWESETEFCSLTNMEQIIKIDECSSSKNTNQTKHMNTLIELTTTSLKTMHWLSQTWMYPRNTSTNNTKCTSKYQIKGNKRVKILFLSLISNKHITMQVKLSHNWSKALSMVMSFAVKKDSYKI